MASNEELEARIAVLEAKVSFLLQHSEYPYTPITPLGADMRGTIAGLIRQGKKLEAIKVYRENTGVGLKDAKDAVDAIEQEIRGRR